ncbi:hypothetical protein GCM10011612_18750 [Actinomyces gaoshouyii]|uniref:TIR domain-containing protein n=1 Tax=Actinomyces gaoshouyii TaxID=1960083 RepID=A0A8H9LJD8_9ACTO|nr:hypothetical protein GCM10011612_18750 [Actinomyces gaoshouyii]
MPAGDSFPPAAQFTIVIPVIDTPLVRATLRDDCPWSLYLKDTLTIDNNGTSHRYVIPIIVDGASPSRGPLADLINRLQGIRINTHKSSDELISPDHPASTKESNRSWIDHLYLEREVSQAIIQLISPDWRIDRPLKVFISHTKKKNSEEMNVARLVKEIIDDTHLEFFFDESSIQTCDEWGKELRNKAGSCALLMIRTDLYASRLWTQEEVLLAKEHDVPIVSLSALILGEERGSFLMDHLPTVAFSQSDAHGSVARALCRLVDEALKRTLWMLQTSFTTVAGFDWKPVHAPEPTTVISWLKNHPRTDPHLWIIHPDPPLTRHEKKLIRDMCELAGFNDNTQLDIVTPREFLSRGGAFHPGQDPSIETGEHTLSGRRLGISVSPSEDLERLGLSESHLDYAVSELAQLTFLHGGTLVYGGRIKRDPHDMTTFMAEQAERYATTTGGSAFENLQPWSEFLAATKEDLREFEDRIQNVGSLWIAFGDKKLSLAEANRHRLSYGNGDTLDHMRTLTEMRLLAASTTDARVLIGGRLQRSCYAVSPGTLEETYLQLQADRPVYICGGFGGIGAVVAKAVGLPTPDGYTAAIPDETGDTKRMLASISEKWWSIDTGLSEAELTDLAVSHHPSTIAGLILRGMNRLANNASNDPTGVPHGGE